VKRARPGRYIALARSDGESSRAFVPTPLPPVPALEIDGALREKLDQALLALGRLDSATALLPDTQLFLYSYVRKEAVLSSQIEGTESSLSDLLLFEADALPGVPLDDVTEVSNYVAALEHGMRRLRGGFPLSGRLIREVHAELLSRGRGAGKAPGEFRRTQNWIGGTRPGNARFVPPPPTEVGRCMGELESWLHDRAERTPALLKAALAHVQFETIHPFLDGNGRVGRLLITLILVNEGVLTEPLLYLSLHFKQHRSTYYDLLDRVRTTGDWEAWLSFFAEGIRDAATGAVATARRLAQLVAADRARLGGLKRLRASALLLHLAMQKRPLVSAQMLARETGLSEPPVNKGLDALIELGVVREITGRRRGRLYTYTGYLDILNEGTEPL
jgi:Fic family protein